MTRKMAGLLHAPADVDNGSGESVRDAFHAAFTDAKASLAAAETDAAAGDEEDDAGDADDEGDDEGDDDAAGETDTAAGAGTKAAAGDKTAATDKTATGDTSLVTDEEFAKLQKQHANDPVALRKSLEGVFTKKTQALAAARTALDTERATVTRLTEYTPLIDAYEADPVATVRELAKLNGLTIADAKGAAAGAAADTTDAGGEMVDEVIDDFKKALGPELEYLADSLAPAMTKLVQKLTAKTVDQSLAPLRDRDATQQTDTIMKAFTATHPDWKDHEDAILALSQRVRPNGMSEGEYLEHLYDTVTSKATIAKLNTDFEDRVQREATGRFKKWKAKVNGGESDGESRSAADEDVRKRPDGPVDFAQAARDAKAGIRYDD